MREPTGFIGLSHLGIVSSICWASRGDPVVGLDPARDAVERLATGILPIHEPGLADLLAGSRDRLQFTSDLSVLSSCPLVILSQDVPTAPDNRSDLSAVERLIDPVIRHLRPGSTLVIMSQVPPGFTRAVAARVKRECADGAVHVYYWVETLVLGRAVDRFLHPERVILGCEDPLAPLPEPLANGIRLFDCPILRMGYESAELTKTAINLYLASAVTYANTLSDLCEQIGANWSEVIPALRLDARIGPSAYIRPSLGIAGGNLERDLATLRCLAVNRQVDGSFIDTIIDHNARRIRWVLGKLDSLVFAEVPNPTIAVWGLAYKKGTQSVKNSPALRVITDLGARATFRAYDPLVRTPLRGRGTTVASKAEALTGADCLLIMTDWDEFASVEPEELRSAMRHPLVIDCVGALEKHRSAMKGVRIVAMGQGNFT